MQHKIIINAITPYTIRIMDAKYKQKSYIYIAIMKISSLYNASLRGDIESTLILFNILKQLSKIDKEIDLFLSGVKKRLNKRHVALKFQHESAKNYQFIAANTVNLLFINVLNKAEMLYQKLLLCKQLDIGAKISNLKMINDIYKFTNQFIGQLINMRNPQHDINTQNIVLEQKQKQLLYFALKHRLMPRYSKRVKHIYEKSMLSI